MELSELPLKRLYWLAVASTLIFIPTTSTESHESIEPPKQSVPFEVEVGISRAEARKVVIKLYPDLVKEYSIDLLVEAHLGYLTEEEFFDKVK